MNKLISLLVLSFAAIAVEAQVQTQVIGDSVRIHGNTGTAELNLENSTDTVSGFLFNKGGGRTQFRRALIRLNDSLYIIGADTLKLLPPGANNGLSLSGSTVQLGGSLIKNTVLDQNGDSLVLVTGDGNSFLQKDKSTDPVILPGNTEFGQVPVRKASKRTGFIVEENAVSVPLGVNSGTFMYSRQITNETFPSATASPAAFGSANSFFSELIQGNSTGTVLNWHVAGPSSLRGRSWSSWLTLVNQFNNYYGNNPVPFVHHSIPFYITPQKNAYYSFYNNAITAGSTFAVDADNIPIYFVNLPAIPLDTINNKPLVINLSTGAIQISNWPASAAGATNDLLHSSLAANENYPAGIPAANKNIYSSAPPATMELNDPRQDQAVLLKKIEKMTLYLIGQNKELVIQNENLQQQLDQTEILKKEIKELKEQIAELRSEIIKKSK